MEKPRFRYNHKTGKCDLVAKNRLITFEEGSQYIEELMKKFLNDDVKPDFNYPECLDKIVDVAMAGVEVKISEFKRMDAHEEIMAMMGKPKTACTGQPMHFGDAQFWVLNY